MSQLTVSSDAESQTEIKKVAAIVDQHRQTPGGLMPVLWAIQSTYGYIANEWVSTIAQGLNLSQAEVHGVVSFYHDFKDRPPANHLIQLCCAEACQAMGSRKLMQLASNQVGIDFDQVTVPNGIKLESVYCLGLCACAPAMSVDGMLHGRVKESVLQRLLSDLLA